MWCRVVWRRRDVKAAPSFSLFVACLQRQQLGGLVWFGFGFSVRLGQKYILKGRSPSSPLAYGVTKITETGPPLIDISKFFNK